MGEKSLIRGQFLATIGAGAGIAGNLDVNVVSHLTIIMLLAQTL